MDKFIELFVFSFPHFCMQLTRRVLDCLEIFRKQIFEDDEALGSYLLDMIVRLSQNVASIHFLNILIIKLYDTILIPKKICVIMEFAFFYFKQQSMD